MDWEMEAFLPVPLGTLKKRATGMESSFHFVLHLAPYEGSDASTMRRRKCHGSDGFQNRFPGWQEQVIFWGQPSKFRGRTQAHANPHAAKR